jgi:hypothetical protein
MKRQILIIEDNYYKFFTMKQVIETHLRLNVKVVGAKDAAELVDASAGIEAENLIVKPEGGVVDLIEMLKRQRLNRRNAEVTIVITPELDHFSNSEIAEICLAHAA